MDKPGTSSSSSPSKQVDDNSDDEKSEPEANDGLDKTIEKFINDLQDSLPTISKEKRPNVLDEFTLQGIANRIKNGQAQNIIVMTGAGISTSAGIPDFRSDKGLYTTLSKHGYKDPQSIFEINTFMRNPQSFFEVAKELFPLHIKPTPCHYFQKLLDDKKLLLRTFTQNIDTLERKAGLDDDKVVYAHGSQSTNTCTGCKKKFDYDWMKDKLFNTNETPLCECGRVVKPDVVFFGENLPKRFFTQATYDFPQCDLLIIMGTSLVVQPFCTLIDRVKDDVPRLLINDTKVGQRSTVARMFGMGGLDYDGKDNYRDVYHQSSCDDSCFKLAEMLGWTADLDALIKKDK